MYFKYPLINLYLLPEYCFKSTSHIGMRRSMALKMACAHPDPDFIHWQNLMHLVVSLKENASCAA